MVSSKIFILFAIPFMAKGFAMTSPIKRKPFNCDSCLAYWFTLFLGIYLHVDVVYLIVVPFVNVYLNYVYKQIANKLFSGVW